MISKRLNDERGAVLVIVAAGLTAMVLVVALVIEVGNWYEHKRHLQLQADAAALAGGASFQLPGCSNTAIYSAVRKYAGVKDATYTAPYNKQIGVTTDANAHILVNSTSYWDAGGTNVDYTDGGAPCTNSMIDVKMTETNLPWFLRLAVVPKINAHARVGMKLVDTLAGQMPIGVPDVNPQSGAVIFYDEATLKVSKDDFVFGIVAVDRDGNACVRDDAAQWPAGRRHGVQQRRATDSAAAEHRGNERHADLRAGARRLLQQSEL